MRRPNRAASEAIPTHLNRSGLFPACPVAVSIHDHDAESSPHDHDFIELAIVVEGRTAHAYAGGDQVLERGAIVCVQPGAWHGYGAADEGTRICNILIGPELLRGELSWVFADPKLHRLIWSGPFEPRAFGVTVASLVPASWPAIDAAVTALVDAIGSQQVRDTAWGAVSHPPTMAAGRYTSIGLLLCLLGRISEGLDMPATPVAGQVPAVDLTGHPAVGRAVAMIDADLRRPWTLTRLARAVNLAPAYLSRRFHAQTGSSPIQYVNRRRGERAAKLLLQTGKPVIEIGIDVGWPDPRHLARRFKAQFGVSASEYRRRFGGGAR